MAAARGTQVGAAVPGAGRPGVRLADRGELHPSRLRGGAGGHRRRQAGRRPGSSGAQWIEAVREQTASPAAASLVNELGVESISVDDDEKLPRYISGVLARLQEVWVGRQIAEVKSKLQRMSPVEQGDEYHALFGDLVAMEAYRRSLLEQASGDDLTA